MTRLARDRAVLVSITCLLLAMHSANDWLRTRHFLDAAFVPVWAGASAYYCIRAIKESQ